MRKEITHGAVDRSKRHESLHVVGQVSTVGIPVRILSSLQDELLSLEVMVLITYPAIEKECPVIHRHILLDEKFLSAHSFNTMTYAPLSTRIERMLSKPHS